MIKGRLMVQGTASSVGKSIICAAICRILKQDGYRVAPFKSQNMALNSFVTRDGLEMGRAQVMQAEAAGTEPLVEMNPVLLKPVSDQGAQVIVMGKSIGNMGAVEYLGWKEKLIPVIENSFNSLTRSFDLVIIEGAGSPAEINLKGQDLVNMGLARRLQVPVLLVGDIDRGGVFASLYGTAALLEAEERALLKGVVINKFRGDRKILEPGLKQLEELINLPVIGVVPFLSLNLDDEDSVADRFNRRSEPGGVKVRVIILPRIANFTDFNPLELDNDIDFSYIRDPGELDSPDLLVIPGSKNTIDDLLYLRRNGWEQHLREHVRAGRLLFGICGGFQMLGRQVSDPDGVESNVSRAAGFSFLDMETVMAKEKTTRQVKAAWRYRDNNYFSAMPGELPLEGYEIHMGRTDYRMVSQPVYLCESGRWEGAVNREGNVFGTYLHGIFDNLAWTRNLLNGLRRRRGLPEKTGTFPRTYHEHKDKEYNRLADAVRENLDLEQLYGIIKRGVGS